MSSPNLGSHIDALKANNCRSIVLCSGKGGVGKTTLTANLGVALAKLNKKTCVVDADYGLRNLDLLLGLESRIVFTAQEVISGGCRLEQALVRHKHETNLMLMPAGNPRMLDWFSSEHMRTLITLLSESFDFILIDAPAGVEDGFKNAVAGASEAILVVNPEISSVRDADRVAGLLASQGTIDTIQLLVNRVRPRMVEKLDMLSIEDVLDILAIPLLGVVQEDEQVIIAANLGEPLALGKPKSPAAFAYGNIARRIQGEDIPIPDINAKHGGFVGRLGEFLSTKII